MYRMCVADNGMSLDWPQEETEQGQGSTAANGTNTHLWEESWDDDDESEDFSKQLKYAITISFIPWKIKVKPITFR